MVNLLHSGWEWWPLGYWACHNSFGFSYFHGILFIYASYNCAKRCMVLVVRIVLGLGLWHPCPQVTTHPLLDTRTSKMVPVSLTNNLFSACRFNRLPHSILAPEPPQTPQTHENFLSYTMTQICCPHSHCPLSFDPESPVRVSSMEFSNSLAHWWPHVSHLLDFPCKHMYIKTHSPASICHPQLDPALHVNLNKYPQQIFSQCTVPTAWLAPVGSPVSASMHTGPLRKKNCPMQ